MHTVERVAHVRSVWTRIFAALFILLSGAFASLLLLLSAPSLWYVPCAVLWALSGIIWFFRPSFAASFSAFPVLGVAVLMVQILPHFREMDFSYLPLLLCVVLALALIVAFLKWAGAIEIIPMAISFGLILIGFGVDRLWTKKVQVHEYSMNWSANGTAPWGQVETSEMGESPVVVYRRVAGGYCYDAVFSPELKAKLMRSNEPSVAVEYDVFSDFGHERGYNIRSIDGVVFNEGDRNLRPGEMYGGYIETDASHSVDCRR
jgi:hypothetical protein